MDADPVVQELDSFSTRLPLPYRLAILIVLGIWLWGLNLQCFHQLRIDLPHLIRYPARSSHTEPPHHISVYRIAALLSIPLGLSLVFFWTSTRGAPSSVLAWSILPNAYLILLLVVLILPLKALSRSGRYRLLSTLRRISIGGLARSDEGKFGDILLADALTSYAKPLSEIYVTICMFVTGQHTTNKPDRNCGGTLIVPFLISVPFLIRFRQCIIDRQPANALKYASALPAIGLSAMQRNAEAFGISDISLFRLWFFAAMINSLYSFWWDVQRDWDLTLFSSARFSSEYPYGLRRIRIFHPASLYYVVIFIDLLLRCTWSLKLSVHLTHFNDIEGGIFLVELLEVGRRWMWAFFRIEAEHLRHRREGDGMIVLDEYSDKVDEE